MLRAATRVFLPTPASRHSLRHVRELSSAVVFTVHDQPGALRKALEFLEHSQVNLSSIRSKRSTEPNEFHIEIETSQPVQNLPASVRNILNGLQRRGMRASLAEVIPAESKATDAPWFPKKISDLDAFSSNCLQFGGQLDADHPGFHDEEYRLRRARITENAMRYKHGQRLPSVDYTPAEQQTWGVVYEKLAALRPAHACREYNTAMRLLEQDGIFTPRAIPQLGDVSAYLSSATGFTLKPVMGLLSPRDFLNGLAFRVFHATQYIRHPSRPLYTPEPDVCHEMLGHAPMLCDAQFAQMSQEIGLSSLGATDEDIERLSRVYWFSVEFGLCREKGVGAADKEIRGFGAGVLSSFGELEHAHSGKPQLLDWDPETAARTNYPIEKYQPTYFVAKSFASATEKIRQFASTLERPFEVEFCPYSRSIKVLSREEKADRLACELKRTSDELGRLLHK